MITITFSKIWFLMFLLGLFGFPIFFTVFRNLADRGYSISKYATLIIISYIGWILGHIGIEFTKTTLWLITFIYFVIGSLFFIFNKKEIIAYLKKYFVTILIIELVFIISFGFFIKMASYNGSIVIEPGTEAMMDYMMIQSVLQSKTFPQWDLWLAGEKVNYYYFGWVNVAALKLLTDIDLPVMFNAFIGMVYALIFMAAFGLGFNFSRKYKFALLTAFLMIIIGNLNGFVQVMGPKKFFDMNWFEAARVIEGTINEFPFFSFIYGDLHSYVLAFPVAMICLFISLNLFFEKKKIAFLSEKKIDNVTSFLVYTITFGSLIPTNTWDYPSYFMIFFFSFAVRNFIIKESTLMEKIKKTFIPSVTLFISGIVFYLPYFLAFKQKREIKLVSYSRSDFTDFFQIFGTYITFTLILFCISYWYLNHGKSKKQNLMLLLFMISAVIIVFNQITYLYLIAYILLGLFIAIKFFSSKVEINQEQINSEDQKENHELHQNNYLRKSIIYISLLASVAAFYGLFCELFYVNDHYSGKLERMNTIFKVYLEMWFIWSFAACFAIYIVTHYFLKNSKFLYKSIWFSLIAIFILMGIVYPISSTYVKTGRFRSESTLEGLKRAARVHSSDYKAIVWMQENVEGVPVVLESWGNAYDWASRFATFGGFRTILGWANHEAGWRNDWDTVNKRLNDINLAYKTMDIQKTNEIFDKYNVEFVVVGSLEKKNYSAQSLSKFKNFMKTIYDRDNVKIFKRKK